MSYKSRPCEECGEDLRPSRSNVKRHLECRRAAGWKGRPFDDPRNNFRLADLPAARAVRESPKRDVLASPIRVGVVDIETTGLDASFGRVLCGVTLLFSPDEERIRRADDFDTFTTGKRASDKELVEEILKDIDDCDIVFGHNATYFDLPFLRTRALIHGLPPVNPKKIVDPVLLARKVFRFHSNSLESISTVLGTKDKKTPLLPQIWTRAMYDGDTAALDEIVAHCVEDCRVLCEVARRVSPYVKAIDSIGSFRQ